VPPKLLPGGHFGLLLRFQLKDDLASLIARAQIPKPLHSKGVIQKALHPPELVPPSRDLQGPAMRPLFLFRRASGASTKYLYDKTFEMNRFSSVVHGRIGTPRHEYESKGSVAFPVYMGQLS
jgi:hypothetical protein